MRQLVIGVAVAALVAGAGCGSSSSGDVQSRLQGSWSSCLAEASTSRQTRMVFSGSSYTTTSTTYGNATCSGTGAVENASSGTISVGGSVKAGLGASTVTAHLVDVAFAGGAAYDIFSIDTASAPDRLYLGDSSGTKDGSAPALRPTTIDEAFHLSRQ